MHIRIHWPEYTESKATQGIKHPDNQEERLTAWSCPLDSLTVTYRATCAV